MNQSEKERHSELWKIRKKKDIGLHKNFLEKKESRAKKEKQHIQKKPSQRQNFKSLVSLDFAEQNQG